MADILSPDILEKIRFVPISVVAQMKGKSVVAIHRDIKKNKLMFMRIGDEYVWLYGRMSMRIISERSIIVNLINTR